MCVLLQQERASLRIGLEETKNKPDNGTPPLITDN